ncbi:MAG TPA: 30S ribosomal protein S20 [Candidatus Saccharimonadia bacterium]|nr:30S ribosomal protein S20 [Candidatus Saccharimonadia bacterium]
MPIIQSAKKRVRVARKASVRNSKTKRNLKASLKLFAKSPSAKTQSAAQSNLDIAVKKGVIHKNKAARLKKQAAARAKAAGVKPGKAAAKPVAKKAAPAAKKTAAKKPATKKAPAKK